MWIAVTPGGEGNGHTGALLRYKTGEIWQDEVCLFDVVVFGRQAETVGEYLHKGSQALIERRLRQRTWENATGQPHRKHEVVADRVYVLGTRSQGPETTLPLGDVEAVNPEAEAIPF
ncbi:MAG: single-stranded DNA-binding protein [Candidatus Tectomicrobia bacterium]|uniref:Single-stranded DNA-binding protein n=1 Tax=Tectimicrobiota bacterium TaxID=2528274 RepID=A0A937W263_UNCTE|nr:single-stranded DNA-binding protein [Candidatus Tectomicrobia bacterium]